MGPFGWLRNGSMRAAPDGTSPATAIVVNAVDEEYAWIRENCPGWQVGVQAFEDIDTRSYDIITLRHERDGRERTVYFDVTSFMGPNVTNDSPGMPSGSPAHAPKTPAGIMFPLDDVFNSLARHRNVRIHLAQLVIEIFDQWMLDQPSHRSGGAPQVVGNGAVRGQE